ncbi:HTTM domain-containing protein [Mycolicibacterium sp. XJ1819]
MNLKSGAQNMGREALQGWRNFWFGPQLAYTLGIVRIAFGALIIGWTLLLSSDLYIAFGTKGIMPQPPPQAYTWGIFNEFSSDTALLIGWIVLLGAAIALTVGWHSRLAAIIVFVLILSFQRRDPLIFNLGDVVIRLEALFLALAPCGAALSLDQRRRDGSFWSAREIRPWALRLMQIQLSIIYISTVIAKTAGETWHNGTAVAYALRQRDLQIIPLPSFLYDNLLILNALTWGTLIIEVAIGVLVWNRRWRPWVLAAGVMLHAGISLTLEVGFFSFAMFILYLAFIPPERAEAIATGAQRRLAALTARLLRRDAEVVDDEVDPAPSDERRDPAAQPVSHRSTDRVLVSDEYQDDSEAAKPPADTAARISAALEAAKQNGDIAPRTAKRWRNGHAPSGPTVRIDTNKRQAVNAAGVSTGVAVSERRGGDRASTAGRHSRDDDR